jgi:hypothetical protein
MSCHISGTVCPDGRGTLSAPKTYCEFCGPDGGY